MAHEDRRVIHHREIDSFGEILFQFLHRVAHLLREGDGIGARRLENGQRHCGLVVQQRTQRIAGGAQFDSRDIFEQRFFAVRPALDDDLAKFFRRDQPAFGIDLQLEIHRLADWLLADRAGGHLHVLLADGVDDVAGGKILGGYFVRVEPNSHRVITGTEHFNVPCPRNTRQHVLDLESRVIAQIHFVIPVIRRKQMDDHGEVWGLLGRGDAEAAHFFGQFRQRLGDAVLHLHLRLIDVGAELEGNRQGHDPIRGRLGKHVERLFDAVNDLLERRGHRFGDGLWIGARIAGAHDNRRRHHFRIFADRQTPHRNQAEQENDAGKHAREDRAADEKVGEVHSW